MTPTRSEHGSSICLKRLIIDLSFNIVLAQQTHKFHEGKTILASIKR